MIVSKPLAEDIDLEPIRKSEDRDFELRAGAPHPHAAQNRSLPALVPDRYLHFPFGFHIQKDCEDDDGALD
jgi:hypothetical protein